MLENEINYSLIRNRTSAMVGSPQWKKDHKRIQAFRPPPKAIYSERRGIDYVKLIKDFGKYIIDLRVYNDNFSQGKGLKVKETRDIKSFDAHLKIMKIYFDELYKYESFRKLLDGKPKEFLYFLVDLHDFFRNIINGTYPLEYTERVSEGLEKWVIAKIFGKEHVAEYAPYFHTFRWITGEEDVPDFDTATNPQKISLILKFIDTISKGSKGELIDPESIFHPGGPYDAWGNNQLKMKRFPLRAFKRDEQHHLRQWNVDLDMYKEKDKKLTNFGKQFTEGVIGVSFGQVFQRVKEQTRELHLFNH